MTVVVHAAERLTTAVTRCLPAIGREWIGRDLLARGLVKGRTNRQIAEELFISENTAGGHVSNIPGKLGASTRTEAAGIAANLRLGSDR